MPGKIRVSAATYDEIAIALGKQGQKINEQGSLLIDKDMEIAMPYDLRLASIRKDCLGLACGINQDNPLPLAQQMFDFVLESKVPENGKEWK